MKIIRTKSKFKIGLTIVAVSIVTTIGMAECSNNTGGSSSETLIENTEDSNNVSDNSSETLNEITEDSNNVNDNFSKTELSRKIRIEYFKEAKLIDDYDAEIAEIERLEKSAIDKVEKAKLKAKKLELIRTREELAKDICKRYEDWRYKYRNLYPTNNKH
jgi:hypothetical protein